MTDQALTRRHESSAFPWRFFALAFAITWLIWSPGLMSTAGWFALPVPFLVFFFMGTWGPFLAACLVTMREAGRAGLDRYLRRMLDCRFGAVWIVPMVIIPLLAAALPIGIHLLLGGDPPVETLLSRPWMILPVFLTYFCTGGGNEELGWRGYALDRLQARWSPLAAAIVLGVIWAFWHLPLFFIEETGQYHMVFLAFAAAVPAMSIIHSWIYNRTGGNMVAAWLFHAGIGTAWEVFPNVQPEISGYERVQTISFGILIMVAAILVIVEGGEVGRGR